MITPSEFIIGGAAQIDRLDIFFFYEKFNVAVERCLCCVCERLSDLLHGPGTIFAEEVEESMAIFAASRAIHFQNGFKSAVVKGSGGHKRG